MTACLRKLFANKEFEVDYDNGCFTGEGGFDGLRDVACDLSKDLIKDFGTNLIKRSSSIIRNNTFSTNTLKDAEVRDLRKA